MFLREKPLASLVEVSGQAELYVESIWGGEFSGRRYVNPKSVGTSQSSYRNVETDHIEMIDRQKCYRCCKTDHTIRDCMLVKTSAAALFENAGHRIEVGIRILIEVLVVERAMAVKEAIVNTAEVTTGMTQKQSHR